MPVRDAIEGQHQYGADSAQTIALSELIVEVLARDLGVAGTNPPPSLVVPGAPPIAYGLQPVSAAGPDSGGAFRMFRNLIYLAAALYAGYLIATDILYPKHDPTFAGPSEFADFRLGPRITLEGTGVRSAKGAESLSCSMRRQERAALPRRRR